MFSRVAEYLFGITFLTLALFFVIVSWLETEEPTIAFFLALICSHFIIDKIDRLNSEATKVES